MARTARTSRTAKVRPTAPAPSVRSIDSYGRVSKRVAPSSAKKTAATTAKEAAAVERVLAQQKSQIRTPQTPQKANITIQLPALPQTPAATPSPASTRTSRKRRAADSVDDDASSEASVTPTKRTRRAKTSIAALLKKRKSEDALGSESEASTVSASRPTTAASSFSSAVSVVSSVSSVSTAPTSPCSSDAESESYFSLVILPPELLDLQRLQAAFVKTLALHLAHHGSNAPVDIRVLCPSVAQSWGKRRVTLEDVRRCIGLATSNGKADVLAVSDYGRGKTCIELRPEAGAVGTLANRLNEAFEANLRAQWSAAVARGSADAKQFIKSLPKAPVAKCASLIQTAAVRARGQRTLEELMHGIALKKQEQEAKQAQLKAVPAPEKASTTQEQPKMSLLDRIRYRQLQRTQQAAAGAASPSPEELERRAALHRACDIAEVLAMLCTSSRQQSRVSFGMAAVLTKLRDSLRLPISREEGASCVRLLAKEVAPQWIQIVSMGGREIVVMLTDSMPSKAELQSRVDGLAA